jgi:peptidyl-prolyl cis-trans isomerase D
MDYYLINKDRFLQDEQRRAQHILILFSDNELEAEETAIKVLERINFGESFSELAAKFSQDSASSDNGGDLGNLTLMQLPEALGEAVFSMKPGEIKGPIKGDFGFHLVRLNEILKSGPLPYEQVRDSLLSEMQENQGEQIYLDLIRKLTDALFDATDIQQLADAFGSDVISVKDYKRDNVEPFNGNELAVDLIFDPNLLDSLSNSNEPQLTDVIELDIDRTIVVSVFNHSIASRDSLENVKNQIVASLTLEQSNSLMAANAQKILQAVREGSEFETAALEVGAEITPSSPFIRNDQNIDQSLLEAIFNAAKPLYGDPTFGSTPDNNGGYTVFRLDSVIAGQPELIPLSDRDNGRLELSNKTGLNDFIALVQVLREKAEVMINEDALAADGVF